MTFHIKLCIMVVLNMAVSFTLVAETYTIHREEADKLYRSFMTQYVKLQKEETYKNIPLHGSFLLVFKTMLYVHCRMSIDPESINRLITNYQLTKHERYCKQLFVMQQIMIPEYDRRPINRIDITVKDDGEIVLMKCHSIDKKLGILTIDKRYFNKQLMYIKIPGYTIKGGMR